MTFSILIWYFCAWNFILFFSWVASSPVLICRTWQFLLGLFSSLEQNWMIYYLVWDFSFRCSVIKMSESWQTSARPHFTCYHVILPLMARNLYVCMWHIITRNIHKDVTTSSVSVRVAKKWRAFVGECWRPRGLSCHKRFSCSLLLLLTLLRSNWCISSRLHCCIVREVESRDSTAVYFSLLPFYIPCILHIILLLIR